METKSKIRRKNQVLIILAFSIIPLILLFIFTYLPFGEMIGFSFFRMRYIGTRKFVGLQNYIELFHRKDIVGSLILSLYYMVGAVVQVFLALYLATILSMKIRAKGLWRGLIFFPYLINGIAIGFIFQFFYTRGFVLDSVLQAFGFKLENLPYWLKDKNINNWSLVYSSIWRYLGQNMVLFIGAIMSVDDSLYEAADLDGANGFQKFWYIILPIPCSAANCLSRNHSIQDRCGIPEHKRYDTAFYMVQFLELCKSLGKGKHGKGIP